MYCLDKKENILVLTFHVTHILHRCYNCPSSVANLTPAPDTLFGQVSEIEVQFSVRPSFKIYLLNEPICCLLSSILLIHWYHIVRNVFDITAKCCAYTFLKALRFGDLLRMQRICVCIDSVTNV